MSLLVQIEKKLEDFHLKVDLESDAITGFLGASGSGKSMTLKCIAGIEKPDNGRIILNGVTLFDSARKINLPPRKRHVGYLFQNYALFPHMTVEQNIRCGLSPQDKRAHREAELVREMIGRMSLEGLEKHKPGELSGGQAQRVALARILIGKPELLLLDEPFSALDAHLKLQMENELRNHLKEYEKDVLFVSHSRDEIYRICNNMVVVDGGRIVGKGPVKAYFQNPGSRKGAALTGCKNIIEAKVIEPGKVHVPDWNRDFTVQRLEIPSDENGSNRCNASRVRAVGIRAHSFRPDCEENLAAIEIVEIVEEPFEWIVKFRYEGAQPESQPIWWRVSKTLYKDGEHFPKYLGVEGADIMLLND